MRVQLPSPQEVLLAIAIIILLTWQVQVSLMFVAFLLICFKHWIVGGIIGLIAGTAFTVRKQNRL